MSADAIRHWRENPARMVRDLFHVEPDAWQARVLQAFPTHPQLAMTACKGPGKTTVLAWLCWNFLLTRPNPKIAAVSITGDNLADNLWPEMAKWQQCSPLLMAQFEWRKTRIELRANPENWFMSARTWPRNGSTEQQADTLAGLHADYILFVLDEAGGMPDAVMVAAKAGLSSCVEGHIVMAGNPTHLEGPLYRANTLERDRWHMTHITGDPDDPLRSSRVSADWARDQIRSYGRENPWVQVNVFGQFPTSSINSLLGPDEVRVAMGRHYAVDQYDFEARILGVDVARQGDDASVIFPRQGLVAFAPVQMRGVETLQGAGQVATQWNRWKADAVFIDQSGGFGAGWIDTLRGLDYAPVGVEFAGKPLDSKFRNKRAEMWWAMAQWIKDGGALPPECEQIVAELTRTTYSFKGDTLMIEPKESIKAKIGRSPDFADALALTFAFPVASARMNAVLQRLGKGRGQVAHGADFDPMTSQ